MKLQRSFQNILLAIVTLVAPALGQANPEPFAFTDAELKPLVAVVTQLASVGRGDEAAELRAALDPLGCSENVLAPLDRRLERVRPRTHGVERQLARATERLTDAVQALAVRLDECTDEARRRELATVILRLDGASADARRALGHSQREGRWLSAAEEAVADRRAEIQAALQQVRRLAPEFTVKPSEHPLLEVAHGHGGHAVAANGLCIHTCWPVAKTKRLVANLLRARALSRHLIHGGAIELPREVGYTSVLFTGKRTYLAALRDDIDHDRTDADWDASSQHAVYFRNDGTAVFDCSSETRALGSIFGDFSAISSSRLLGESEVPTLIAGHTNWVLMALAGAPLPAISYTVEDIGDPKAVGNEPQRLMQRAGLMGAKYWLRSEAREGRDPPWSSSFQPNVGTIRGDDILKTTFVTEFLHCRGPLAPILLATRAAAGRGVPETTAAFEKALGTSLADFEREWRTWFCGLGPTHSVLERLRGHGESGGADATVLDRLKRIRTAAYAKTALESLLPPIEIEPELSQWARLHASYLERHPDQVATWPDAHEEYPDREGFTAEGSWSGMHSAISHGVERPAQAIDSWMGTFYHRLRLLEPGLMRIGWALEGTTCVLDSGSVVRDVELAWEVAWPPDGMEGVPRSFVAEQPHPFPGEDQSQWGYPITLLLGPRANAAMPVIEMTLRKDRSDGEIVPCLVSTPQQPGNPLLVPEGAWCLIPKQRLDARTTYHVTAELSGAELGIGGTRMSWSFRSGR